MNTISLPLHNIQDFSPKERRQRKCIKRHCPDDERDIIFVWNINKKSKRMNVMCAISSYFLSHQSNIKFVCLCIGKSKYEKEKLKGKRKCEQFILALVSLRDDYGNEYFGKSGERREGDREEYVRIAAYVRLTITTIVIAFHSFKKLFSISASSAQGPFAFATLLRKPTNPERIYFTCVNQFDIYSCNIFSLEAFSVLLFFLIESCSLIFMENNNFSHRRNGERRSGCVTSRFLSFSLWWAHSVKLQFSLYFILFISFCIFIL